MARPIVVVEPQMEGIFHAPFNAALLHTVALSYPGVAITFRAFPGHISVVRGILADHAPGLIEGIEWHAIKSRPASSMPARWRRSRRIFREILAPGERVLFSSVSRMQLLQLKGLMRDNDVVRAVLHGDLDQVEQPVRERFPMSLFALQRVLLRPHPKGLRYLVLSQSIRENIPAGFRAALAEPGVIDHPYHFFPVGPAAASEAIFGVFGNAGDGRLLEQVARQVKAVNPSVRIRLIGFVADQATADRLRPFVEDVGHEPVSREVFSERAESVTHALWLAPPGSFRLRASGTFFDALAYAKPLIYTANPYIDPYFALEPGIGVRCSTPDDVPGAILGIASGWPSEGYAAAREAIERLRVRFTPEAQAKILPNALNWD